MRPVASLPMETLSVLGADWVRGDQVDRPGVTAHLRTERPVLVIAAIAEVLRVVDGAEVYTFWKRELSPRLVEAESFYLEDFPDCRAYVASRWTTGSGGVILLFEQHH